MNILIFNANNPYLASGIVALNLYNDLKANGHNVRLLTNKFEKEYPDGIISMETSFHANWMKSSLRNKLTWYRKRLKLDPETKTDSKYDFLEFREHKVFYSTDKFLRKSGLKPDIIIVLFAKRFINTKNIYELFKKTGSKIFWLMYDMAPLTGGCHYAWDCNGYKNSCGNCPGLLSSNPQDITHKNFLYKQRFIENSNVQLVAASEWQYKQAKESSLFRNKTIHKILLSTDPDIFKPVDKEPLRRNMGIPAFRKVIFFGSIELTTIRKGMSYLLESLKILKGRIAGTQLENKLLLLIAGHKIEDFVSELPFEYKYLGMLDNTYGIAKAYQAADIFLCPSIEDSGPTMINQSIMTGTPVVSFEMGVAPDLVIAGKTGYVAKIKDSADFAEGIYQILNLDPSQRKQLSTNCRELGLKIGTPKVQIDAFENLFKQQNVS